MPSASLYIGGFFTTLTVIDGSDRQRHNILRSPDDGDWGTNCLRNAADRHLAGLGWKRSADWQYDHARDAHTAPITEV